MKYCLENGFIDDKYKYSQLLSEVKYRIFNEIFENQLNIKKFSGDNDKFVIELIEMDNNNEIINIPFTIETRKNGEFFCWKDSGIIKCGPFLKMNSDESYNKGFLEIIDLMVLCKNTMQMVD